MRSLRSAGAPAPALFCGRPVGFGLANLRPAGHCRGGGWLAGRWALGLRICALHAGAPAPAAPVSCEVRRT